MWSLIAWATGLPRWARLAAAALALVLVAAGAALVWLKSHDSEVVEKHDAAANLQAERKARAADADAADQRLNDARANAEQQESYHEAIEAASSGAPSDAAVRLGCERLRRAGKVDADLPAICGH